jgi:hypothetical protein
MHNVEKRGRGRPPKHIVTPIPLDVIVKRGRGRPKKETMLESIDPIRNENDEHPLSSNAHYIEEIQWFNSIYKIPRQQLQQSERDRKKVATLMKTATIMKALRINEQINIRNKEPQQPSERDENDGHPLSSNAHCIEEIQWFNSIYKIPRQQLSDREKAASLMKAANLMKAFTKSGGGAV